MSKQAKTKLLILGALVLLGAGNTTSTWIRGEHRKALEGLAFVAVIGLLLLLAGRSERLRRQLFATDERADAIGLFAAAWAGFAVFFVLFVTFLVENARGHSGEPYYWLSGLYVALFALLGVARSFRR
jgi:drug/metabolite transporter (DMT)-like permease